MKSTQKGWRRALVAAALSTGALLVGSLAPANAFPLESPTSTPDQTVLTEDHAMGSQIAKHEGQTPISSPAQLDLRGIQASVNGIDVSSHQGNVDWAGQYNAGKRFAYVKATEGTSYINPYFGQQYNGSYNIGMIRGAYHFALPNSSSGAAQANYFVDHGGGWSADGKTLPGALDAEYNPYGATCYGKSQSAMAAWIRDFHDTYHARTGRWPVIYTSTSWWSQCVGTAGNFSSTVPLWVARYSSSVGTLPYAWGFYTFWQYSSSPIDQNVFNGAYDRLQALATNS